MRDLNYFQTNLRPAWAGVPARGVTWSMHSMIVTNEDGNKVLLGNASIVLDSDTCVWGQKIIIDAEKNWLIVDGDKIALPPECKISPDPVPYRTPVSSQSSHIPSSSSTPVSSHFFRPAYQVPSSKPASHIAMVGFDNSYNPPGVRFLNIRTTNMFTAEGCVMVKTGDVLFKSGERVSLDEYQNMTGEERESRNNAEPATAMGSSAGF